MNRSHYVTATITEGRTEWARRLTLDRATWERELGSAKRVMVEIGDADVLNCDVVASATEVAITILPGTASTGPCRIRLPRLSTAAGAPVTPGGPYAGSGRSFQPGDDQ